MKKIRDFLFPEKNENYCKAKNSLSKIKGRFDKFILDFPDVTPNEIIFINDKISNSTNNENDLLALNEDKVLLTSYGPNTNITNQIEREFGIVIKGDIVNTLTGEKYSAGDTFHFNPIKNTKLHSNNNGCLIYLPITKILNTELNLM